MATDERDELADADDLELEAEEATIERDLALLERRDRDAMAEIYRTLDAYCHP